MKLKIILIFCLCLLMASVTAPANAQNVNTGKANRLFDVYGDIEEEDEMARLDNVSIQLQKEPGVVAHFIVYGGRRSCAGEAQARARRAKDYLVNARGESFDRVIWRDGGYREEVAVEVYLFPRGAAEPLIAPTILPSKVKIKKKCKGRGRS
jgi:hypothetical protein